MTLAIIGAILAILAALAPAIARWIKSRQDLLEDPETDRNRRTDTAENDIATTQAGLAPDASAHGLADLDALDRLRAASDNHRPK